MGNLVNFPCTDRDIILQIQAEIYIVMAAVFWRFELRLVDTIFERDIQTVRDYLHGQFHRYLYLMDTH